MKKDRLVLLAGIAAPVLFWLTTILCAFILGNYNHRVRLVSELGAQGTKTRSLFALGLVLTGFLSSLLIFGLHRICKKRGLSVAPVLILLTLAFSIISAGIFPMPTKLHELGGMPSIFMPLSPLLALILWKKNGLSNLKLAAILSLVLMIMGFFVYFPNIMDGQFGLKQRFFHLGWSIWFVYLSWVFRKGLKVSARETNIFVR